MHDSRKNKINIRTSNFKSRLNGLSAFSFSIVSILGFGITFIQNFVFAAILDKESFGKIFLVSTLFSTFSYLSIFGLDTSIFKYYFDKKFENKQDLRFSIFHTWLLLSLGLFTILLILGYILINHCQFNLLTYNYEFILLVISGILFSFFLIFQQYFIASKQLSFYFLSSFGVRAVVLIFNVGSIWIFGPSVNSFVKSYFASTLLLFLIAVSSLFFFSTRRAVRRDLIGEIFSFSTPLIFNGLISISFTNGYRILLSALIPFAGLAVFGIISQISSAYYIGLSSLVLPYNSSAYQYLQERHKENIREIPFYKAKIIQLGLSGFGGILIISFFLLKYFKSGLYFEGLKMLPVLLVGQFFFLMYSHEHIILSYWKNTSKITFSTLIGVTVILISFYFLVSGWGLWGACIVSLMGYLCQYVAAVTFKNNL
jgi:O-antigen/teichoic acid export membrane protein